MSIFIERIDDFTKEKKYPPTPSQWQAIGMNGCDILVSAAAGSGKTEVLSERISRKIACDKWNIDRLLVLTFTTAAAKNMLIRIENKIEERLLKSGSKEDLLHLKNQRLLMGDAKVTTIDSFCLNVLKKFYYLVEESVAGKIRYLSPNFKVLSNNKILLKDTVDYTIEQFAHEDKNLLDVLFEVFDSKEKIMTFLINFYTKMLTIPNYKDYIKNNLVKNLKEDTSYQDIYTRLKSINTNNIFEELATIQQAVSSLLAIKNKENNLDFANLSKERQDFFNKQIKNLDLDESFNNKQVLKEVLTSILLDIENKDVGAVYNKILQLLDFLEAKVKIELLCLAIPKILLAIDDNFILEKRTQGFLDFSDLNHLAIKALEKNIDGKKYPTEASEYYKKLFLEIYVDEYQDNNDLQEYILNLIRAEDTYFFRVGDVKQSIYGFRGSNPDLFEEKYQTFTKISDLISDNDFDFNREYKFDKELKGVCVVLKENFRSYDNVLKSSNFIFNRLMYKKNAGVSYDKDSALYFPSVKEKEEQRIATHILCARPKQKLNNEVIIHNIAREISHGISQGNNYSDYAILLRSAFNIKKYKEILNSYGIPVYFKEKEGLTESHSFNLILNLIRFLDNPSFDYALSVLLHSSIFKFSNEDLLKLSLLDGKNLYEKLKISKEEKAKYALSMLQRWLNFSFNFKPIDVVLQFAKDIDFMEYMRTKDMDDTEIDYYENCLDIIREASNNINLSYTLKVLNDIREAGEYDTKRKSSKNSVTISTIHISKGLEYEYVFVAELEKEISKKDYSDKIIFSRDLGLSIDEKMWYPATNNKNYYLNSLFIKKKSYEEEIRNLYVALTRAVKGLYLTTTAEINLGGEESLEINDKEQTLAKFESVKSFADMLNIVASYYDMDNLADETEEDSLFKIFEIDTVAENEITSEDVNFDFLNEEVSLEIADLNLASSSQIKNDTYPAKTSYSALKQANNKTKISQKEKNEYLLLKNLSKKNKASQAIMKGNIIHKLFERIVIDFRNNNLISDINSYLASLLKSSDDFLNIKEKRILNLEEYELINNEIDINLISTFINSRVMDMVKKSDRLATEISFTSPALAKELFKNSSSDMSVILQGVVDLLLIEDSNNYTIIDYKTDYVTEKTGLKILKERHGEQLELYAQAVKKYYGANISVRKYIYSYILGQLIEV
ncbi:UvrD-helicase domain-containing protein [Gemella sp. zg-570]|uniref:UvrD-helicase domain-containing protein n=1 Tax=Gemella sp. zg-570 TaxID=2840371 RepID=UPI001C0AD925|nr:UvrD-helicase domain-containing protein [Gemella sp. zg-570]QWQ38861.1 UvrD-helicase domain-containing protein [Gemella sp. zg-570]